ncbi:uncharacterized protein DEA37_0008023 [Paragonimus westermani]|uniref:EF-hand domain-containing protein n=1 Tax=Paragonimus westermani TaxID=34504 RepID=A0A5J4NXS6_9TREM|nr:uncharacterized protein DEA37_0008023 [Paragonimus westermani]
MDYLNQFAAIDKNRDGLITRRELFKDTVTDFLFMPEIEFFTVLAIQLLPQPQNLVAAMLSGTKTLIYLS